MSINTEEEYAHIGESRGCEDHDHDLIHDLSRRLDCLWRYDQYISNADGNPELLDFREKVKTQEQENIQQVKKLIAEHVQRGCY